MFHDLPAQFLYSAYKIEVEFSDGVTCKTGQGTAFVVASEEGPFAIVTNRHVLEADYRDSSGKHRGFSIKSILMTGRRSDDSLYRFRVDPQSVLRFPGAYQDDVGVLIDPLCEPVENMAKMRLFFHFQLEDVADEEFLASLLPFDVVAFSGFPEEHDRLNERPILRGGRIASDPRFDFSIWGVARGQCIAYESFSHGGASGSPVYAPPKGFASIPGSRHGKLVGINAGHIDARSGQHAGLSYFYRSTVIREVLRANGFKGA